VDITAADTAAFDGNIDVAIFEWLKLEVLLREGLPILLVRDHETCGGVVVLGVNHFHELTVDICWAVLSMTIGKI
jgi:hypothetical protein